MRLFGAGAVISSLLLTSCGGPDISNVDHDEVMKTARENLVKEFIAELDNPQTGTGDYTIDGKVDSPLGGGSLSGSMSVAANAADENINVSIAADGKIDVNLGPMGAGNASFGGEMRILDEVVYMMLKDLSAESDDEMIMASFNEALAGAALITGQWFMIDPESERLSELGIDAGELSSLETSTNIEQNKDLVRLLEKYQIFDRVEVLPVEGGNYVYKVNPNPEGLTSLLRDITLMTNPDMEISENEFEQMKTQLGALVNDDVSHKLYIDMESNTYKKLVTTAELAPSEGITFKLDMTMESKKEKELNFDLKVLGENKLVEQNFTLTANYKGDMKNDDFNFKFDFPDQDMMASFTMKGSFEEGNPTIEAPADAKDFLEIAEQFGALSAPADMDSDDMMDMEEDMVEQPTE